MHHGASIREACLVSCAVLAVSGFRWARAPRANTGGIVAQDRDSNVDSEPQGLDWDAEDAGDEMTASVSGILAAPGLSLFVEQPSLASQADEGIPWLSNRGLDDVVAGVVHSEDQPFTTAADLRQAAGLLHLPTVRLFSATGDCECAYDVREVGPGRLAAAAPRHGPKLPRSRGSTAWSRRAGRSSPSWS